jgi:hypothetical protein
VPVSGDAYLMGLLTPDQIDAAIDDPEARFDRIELVYWAFLIAEAQSRGVTIEQIRAILEDQVRNGNYGSMFGSTHGLLGEDRAALGRGNANLSRVSRIGRVLAITVLGVLASFALLVAAVSWHKGQMRDLAGALAWLVGLILLAIPLRPRRPEPGAVVGRRLWALREAPAPEIRSALPQIISEAHVLGVTTWLDPAIWAEEPG